MTKKSAAQRLHAWGFGEHTHTHTRVYPYGPFVVWTACPHQILPCLLLAAAPLAYITGLTDKAEGTSCSLSCGGLGGWLMFMCHRCLNLCACWLKTIKDEEHKYGMENRVDQVGQGDKFETTYMKWRLAISTRWGIDFHSCLSYEHLMPVCISRCPPLWHPHKEK